MKSMMCSNRLMEKPWRKRQYSFCLEVELERSPEQEECLMAFSFFPFQEEIFWAPLPSSTSLITWAPDQLFQKEKRPKCEQTSLQG